MNGTTFDSYAEALTGFIQRHSAASSGTNAPPDEFNTLALSLFQLQFASVPTFRRLCEARGVSPSNIATWNEIPAVPTSAFKDFELTSLAAAQRTAVFHSSGTTGQRPSRHFHSKESLQMYEQSLLPWFRRHLLPDVAEADEVTFLFLTPSPALAPHSSLVHMFETVQRAFGSADSTFVGSTGRDGTWKFDFENALELMQRSSDSDHPLAVLGTAFSFVHLLDEMAEHDGRLRLPTGSRIMETGGYKGRSRDVSKPELHRLITRHLSVPSSYIVCEYGMTELSSQAYDCVVGAGDRHSRTFRFPPWARVQIISPETGKEVGDGETGLVRVFDLANVRSVLALQTEDLAVKRAGGFELLGRAALAEPRGCSLMPR